MFHRFPRARCLVIFIEGDIEDVMIQTIHCKARMLDNTVTHDSFHAAAYLSDVMTAFTSLAVYIITQLPHIHLH